MTISDIKSSLSITDVLTVCGLKADRNGRMCCPFHDDKTPSMMVYAKTNTVYCHTPSCKHGKKVIDQIDFIMHYENLSKHEALKKATLLAKRYTPKSKQIHSPNHKTMTPSSNPQPAENMDKIFYALRKCFYRGTTARNYAKSRNLDHQKVELGFNPYHNKEYKKLQNCLIFPLKDIDDKVVSLYGRSVSKNPHSKHFYLKGRTGLYPGYPDQSTKTLIICEAIVDAATLQSHLGNIKASILSLFGSNGWREEHTDAIKRLKDLEEVIFFMDGDKAGQKVIDTYAGIVKALAPSCTISRVPTPESEDVNSLLDSHEPEILQHLISSRVNLNQTAAPNNKESTFLFSPESSVSTDTQSIETENQTSEIEEESTVTDQKVNKTESNLSVEEEAPQALQNEATSLPALNLEHPNYIRWNRTDLEFTIIGGLPLYPIDRMLITLGIKKKDSNRPLHNIRQKVNLYQDDFVEKLARKIAERMEISTTRVHESLLELTSVLEKYREVEITKLVGKKKDKKDLSPERTKELMSFLEAPKLDTRTNELIGRTGLVGEIINRRLLWYVYGHRKSPKPLHIMCLGASGTGKTYLQEKIGALMPEEEKKEITSMSSNAVYYFGEDELVNKILILEDLDGANEQNILYALRELMSKTSVTKDVVIKDNKGKFKTISITVKGPVCITGTTTKESLYADNADRTLMIYLDTSPEQVQAVLAYLRKKNAGKINKYEQEKIVLFLQDIQRILKPITIIIPYAEDLVLPTWFLKQYRTNSHYLEFIKAVTFYHQFQRSVKTDEMGNKYIESTYEDIELANTLIKDVLLAKSDELTKATRSFYELLIKYLAQTKKESFKTAEIRMKYRMTPPTIGRHTKKLTQYGYIKIISGNKRKGYEYEVEKKVEDRRGRLGNILDEILAKIKKKYGSDNNEKTDK